MIKRIFKSKINRFLSRKKIFRLIKFFYTHFNKNDIKIGSIGFDYKGKPHRSGVVQEFINLSNCKSYLEIGCYKNKLFNKITSENKIRIDSFEGGNIKKTSDKFFYSNLDTYARYVDQGIGIIFKRLNKNLITINKNFKNLDFSYFFNNYKKLMNIIEFNQIKKII